MIVVKEFEFNAAHKLDWSEKCKNLHGHTYKFQIAVKDNLNENGIVIDFQELEDIVKKEVISKLDHSYLNDIIENPTAENIAIWIWGSLKNKIKLFKVQVWENSNSFVVYQE